jgi:arylsulfatase A-like enzyme
MTNPNIIFMIADDHRHDAIHALGNNEIKTPNLDKLIEQGTTLTHTYIMGSTSPAVCMPSRAMLLSGRSLFHACEQPTGRGTYQFPEHVKLFPELLRKNGYHTHGIGKWHNPKTDFARCFESGENIFFGGMSDHDKVPIYDFDPTGTYDKDQAYIGAKFSTDLFGDAAVDFLHSYEGDKPFCMYLAFTSPHDPRTPPTDFEYDSASISVPDNFLPEHPFDNGEMHIRDEELAPFPRTQEVVQQHIADYYGMITHHDDKIGQILQALSERDDADNTIVVYTADHGLAVGQHGLLGKQNMYDHSMRIPLIITGSTIPQNQKRDALCYLYDMFPTLCELADIPIPATNEGNSLVNLISGTKQTHRSSIFAAYQARIDVPVTGNYQRMVRKDGFKLIQYDVHGNTTSQLFNLIEDPQELNDLSDNTDYIPQLKTLKAELSLWQSDVDDTVTVT